MNQANLRTGRFYGVGVGPGDPELITLKAARVLAQVPVIFVPKKGSESASYARSTIAGLIRPHQEVVELFFPMVKDSGQLDYCWQQAAESIWGRLEHGEDCAFVNSGDPLLYGSFVHVLRTLRQEHPGVETEVIPGISSINAATAKALVPLAIDDDQIAVISGRCEDDFVKETLRNFDTVIFMKMNRVFDRLLGILEELDLVNRCVYVRKCSTQDEEIVTNIVSLKGKRLDYFSLLIVRR